MILLISFSFLAGIVTILSPCILPVLPIILSSSVGGEEVGKLRPLGVVTGFVASFTFFTLFLSTIVRLSGIPAESLRILAVIVIAGFGISLLIPKLQYWLEQVFSRLTRFAPQGNTQSGFGSGVLVGLSLGLIWTPCVGPILASVISLALTGNVTFDAFIIALSYSLGTAIPMLLIMIGGRNLLRKVPWLMSNTARIQKVFGIIMILTALAIFTNADRKFQTFILDTFPQYGVGLTQFEDIEPVRKELEKIGEQDATNTEGGGSAAVDKQSKDTIAPEIIPGGVWLNSEPLTLQQLKGKVVLIDFWTYSCINCQRTLPYLRTWWEKYQGDGLVIIGVHAPEFEFEKNVKNLEKAIEDFQLTYPIVQDNNFDTWRAYNNHYWPAKYLIDKDGYIRYSHFGEGAYDESEEMIQDLLKETGVEDVSSKIENPGYQIYTKTPEMYLGYGRMEYLSSAEPIIPNELGVYSPPAEIPFNSFAFEGNWQIMREYANPQKGARLWLNFDAKEVYLVMRTSGDAARVKVWLDDAMEELGKDVQDGFVIVDADRLYHLIDLTNPGRHTLKLEFEDSHAELFAFTFG